MKSSGASVRGGQGKLKARLAEVTGKEGISALATADMRRDNARLEAERARLEAAAADAAALGEQVPRDVHHSHSGYHRDQVLTWGAAGGRGGAGGGGGGGAPGAPGRGGGGPAGGGDGGGGGVAEG